MKPFSCITVKENAPVLPFFWIPRSWAFFHTLPVFDRCREYITSANQSRHVVLLTGGTCNLRTENRKSAKWPSVPSRILVICCTKFFTNLTQHAHLLCNPCVDRRTGHAYTCDGSACCGRWDPRRSPTLWENWHLFAFVHYITAPFSQ